MDIYYRRDLQMIKKVILIGAGNLGTQLALALSEKGIAIKQVYSRTLKSAQKLAQKVNAAYTNDFSQVVKDADLYIVAVKDAAIEEVLKGLKLKSTSLIVHTAGSIPMDILAGFTGNYGVFYPLQTFSVDRKADFSTIPLCLEANDPVVLSQLYQMAQRISSSIHFIASEDRKTLHLAAVFVNNFVNHLYWAGAEITAQKGLDFDLLKPLIKETAEKIQTMHPLDAQTGPARRNDLQVISNHLIMLEDNPELQKIYSFVSESIARIHQQQNNDLL
jgi:predicted short-subunit dehydrogenase-like oxidoreductase (DUF2520 family)